MKNKEQSPKMKPYCVNVGITPCDTEGISMEDALDNGVSFKQVHKIRKFLKNLYMQCKTNIGLLCLTVNQVWRNPFASSILVILPVDGFVLFK